MKIAMFGVFFMFLGGYMLWMGGQEGYIALTNRAPLEMTCQEYVTKNPSARWLKLTRCSVDYTQAVFIYDKLYKEDSPHKNLYRKVYVPVWPENKPAFAMAKIMKPIPSGQTIQLLETYQKILATLGNSALEEDQKKIKEFLEANKERFFSMETLEGMVIWGALGDSKLRQNLVSKVKGGLDRSTKYTQISQIDI